MYRSLNNAMADLNRSRKRCSSLDSLMEDGESSLLSFLADGSLNAAEIMENREFMLRFSQAVGNLEPKQHAVFVATEMKGCTFRELSGKWNEPVGTLLSRKCRAVKALKEMLADYKP